MEQVIRNARIVLRDEVVQGAVKITAGRIECIDSGPCAVPGSTDFAGDHLLPGFVELHTDNLEKQLEPRPGIFWPDPLSSVLAHDTQMVGAGITTVLDAVSLGEYHDGPGRTRMLDLSIKAIGKARAANVLHADHFLHLRCEYSDPRVIEMLEPHVDDAHLRLVSLMDHTPGQRQFTDPLQYRKYFAKHDWSDAQFDTLSEQLVSTQTVYADLNRARILELCHERKVPVASHDDTTPAHVAQARREGVALAEFPTTREAARHAREAGLGIVMGAPNVVRGGSHSGNVSARDMAAEGLLDVLSSDYVPSSLVSAAFLLGETAGVELPRAVAMISANPAALIGLDDRGEIRPGARADLVRVRMIEGMPLVLQTRCAEAEARLGARAA